MAKGKSTPAKIKTTAKSTGRVVGELIPQPHGGALRNGGPNAGGTGRPPSEIRKKLRGSFEDRVKVLEAIADDTKASPADRMRALDLMGKYGLGTTMTETDTEGNDVTVRVVRQARRAVG